MCSEPLQADILSILGCAADKSNNVVVAMNLKRSVKHHLDVNNQCTSFSNRLAQSCLCGSAIFYNQLLLFSPRSSCCKVKLGHPARNTQQQAMTPSPSTQTTTPPHNTNHISESSVTLELLLIFNFFFAHIGNEKRPMRRNLLMEQQVFSDSVNKATSS